MDDTIDDWELQRILEESQKAVRCKNCFHYEKQEAVAPAYAHCKLKGEIKKYDEYCWEWTTTPWGRCQLASQKETAMSQYKVKKILSASLKGIDGVTLDDHGPIYLRHKGRRFPTFKLTWANEKFNVCLNFGGVKSPALMSIRNEDEAMKFVKAYKLMTEIRAGRKG
ncbi:hypothetical protein [Syntrophobacter fumaroxidans]|uniref:Uncharacterized protein n=1 Tax=Syntrophobacter fumaroxidans (strain DSM 10017 / MPOB) TaxID=335543 RepID=A0LJV8_SYNFM|nr:hypothetical protein [Syntrophobacter fumaroxidans]ABK17710.1 hypothetical protein Sfum_2027 [Syntrophobacter fumaroxidans MPOB]